MTPAPIVLFVYKRLETTKAVIASLLRNPLAARSELHVFADGPRPDALRREARAVEDVRAFVRDIRGFSRVVVRESPVNMGLANSVIAGVTAVLQEYPSAIVVEDDLVVSRHFLDYMNAGLAMYADDPEVASIHGYMYPGETVFPETFFIRGADCWGWATWADAWNIFERNGETLLAQIREQGLEEAFNMNGKMPYTRMLEGQIAGLVDSWAIRWNASAFLRNRLTLYPARSLVRNIGFGRDATHTRGEYLENQAGLAAARVRLERIPLREDPDVRRMFCEVVR